MFVIPFRAGRRLIKSWLILGLLSFFIFPGLVAGQSASKKTTVLFLGDSLTEGYGLEKEDAFPALFGKELEAKGLQSVKVINAGISGSTSASALSRMKWYLRIKPCIVVIALGANDGLRGLSPKEMKANLSKTIQMALDKKIQVVLAGMRIPPNYGLEYTADFEAVYPELAKSFNIPLIPFLLDGVAGQPELNLPDGIHPNSEGHKIISKIVTQALMPLLPQS